MTAPANHKGRIITPRLPAEHAGDDPLPHGSLVEPDRDPSTHRIWVNDRALPVTEENMKAAGWDQADGSWFPRGTLAA